MGNEGTILVGGPGGDTLVGWLPATMAEVDNAGDQVIEMADEGDDVVASADSLPTAARMSRA